MPMKVVRSYNFSVINIKDMGYNMINILNISMLYKKVARRVNAKSSHHKEKLSFPFILCMFI